MAMGVKYQISLVSKPKEMLLVTLNHLDSIQPLVSHSSSSTQLVENCYKRLFKVSGILMEIETVKNYQYSFSLLLIFRPIRI